MNEGWISLHRKIRNHWLYTESRKFSRLEAWIDILLMANFVDKEVCMGEEVVHVKRGMFITSIKQMCKKWEWSNRKVKSFLDLLQREGMISYKCDNKKTVVNVVNYCLYQDDISHEPHQNLTESTSVSHRGHTKNKDKERQDKDNSMGKIEYAEFVTMTSVEHEKLVSTYGEEVTGRMIEILDNYKGSSGRKYKSDYRAILNWVVERAVGAKKPVQIPNARAYKADKDKCPLCRDTGWIVDEAGNARRCECQKEGVVC